MDTFRAARLSGPGTVDALDGELLILDGTAHQLHVDGGVERADPTIRTPFAVITTFVPHITREVAARTTAAELKDTFIRALS